ncbi:hypothetical protein [Wenzhouxiangella marina]|uniref:Uncharacterized protein n=1 Tax=Wenzhouxiangella marina TaxID=1579979 RepID=A0A0K0XTK3_9GAMM|nr:hypothetical protein [Wenzhouxiangella marina]AKS40952.1 hypothetical protein WM2015_570 [Wenzhouxiangella marina]MBB6087826.1 AmpE protein [Wenzhouxiangella marina]
MTVLVVLIGLLISHHATGVRHLRRFEAWMGPLHWVRKRWSEQPWLVLVTLIVSIWLVVALAEWLTMGALGMVGWFLLALLAFIYCLGPRDLDQDIACLLDPASDPAQRATVLRAMQLAEGDSPAAASAAVYHAALSRWFGLLFWFVVLGIPGALLYRLVRAALQEPLGDEASAWLARLRLVLDFPVLFLVVLSAGLCSDLDRVHRLWRDVPDDEPLWGLTPRILDRIGEEMIESDADVDQALESAHRLVWRMLVLWLVVMSLFLLAGWLV